MEDRVRLHRDGLASVPNHLSRATLWLMLFQLTAIATSGPWFLAAYFSISPLVDPDLPLARYRPSHLAMPVDVLLVPVSALIGYIAPIILMSLRSPSVMSTTSKQLAIALWNVFPLTMTIIQMGLHSAASLVGGSKDSTTVVDSPDRGDFLWAVRICYAFSLVFSCASHIGVIAVSALSVLFPMILGPEYVSAFQPGKLLIPPFSRTAAPTFGEGDLSFMKWDQMIGYACMVLHACMTYRQTQAKLGVRGGWGLYAAGLGGCMIAGPGSTILAIHWAKDELLFGGKTEDQTSKGRSRDTMDKS